MADLTCSGSEWSLEDCSWSVPDETCSAHAADTVVFCSQTATEVPEGSVRLLAADGSPAIDGKGRPEIYLQQSWQPVCSSGMTAGAAAVICKSMGFSGTLGAASKCGAAAACGTVAPGISELACTGQESNVLKCPHEAGDDVFCAPSESVVVTCSGDGETQGRAPKEAPPQPSLAAGAAPQVFSH